MPEIVIRACLQSDISAIQTIYSTAVLTGTASFETEAPSVEEMVRRRSALVDAGFPYLVAVAPSGGSTGPDASETLLGYAYAGPYRPRPAYRFSVENSVYVAPEAHGRGIGKRLLQALVEACEALGYRRMIAVIGDSNNHASIGLHVKNGFEHVGILPSVGFKHGKWLDCVLMQRSLSDGDATLPE